MTAETNKTGHAAFLGVQTIAVQTTNFYRLSGGAIRRRTWPARHAWITATNRRRASVGMTVFANNHAAH